MAETKHHPKKIATVQTDTKLHARRLSPSSSLASATAAPSVGPEWPAEVPIRFLREVGTRAWLRIFWGDDCPNAYGHPGQRGGHNARTPIVDSVQLENWKLGGEPSDHPAERWPAACEHCGAPVPSPAELEAEPWRRQVFQARLYAAPDGELVDRPRPGDAFYATWRHDAEGRCGLWDNCSATGHLVVVCPDGVEWDTGSRASNCTRRDDRLHRCWVRSGRPEDGTITVDKGGDTCDAGAGSIQTERYHGHLVGGVLRRC